MDDQDKKYIKVLMLWLLIFLAIFLFLVLRWLYVDAIGNPFDLTKLTEDSNEEKRAALGALGDYFGGLLNPILAFLSFIALLYTLKLNQEELAETRKELARAAQAQEDSKKVMDEQLKTQFLQQFDSLFFALINQMGNELQSILQIDDHNKVRNFKDFINYKSKHKIYLITLKDMNKFVNKNIDKKNFYLFLYQILKNIDEKVHETNVFSENEKVSISERYVDIVRSLLPDVILKIMLVDLYVMSPYNYIKNLKVLIEEMSILQYIDLIESEEISSSFILSILYFKPIAFGNNPDYQKIKNNIFYKFLSEKEHKPISIIEGIFAFLKKWDNAINNKNEISIKTTRHTDTFTFNFSTESDCLDGVYYHGLFFKGGVSKFIFSEDNKLVLLVEYDGQYGKLDLYESNNELLILPHILPSKE